MTQEPQPRTGATPDRPPRPRLQARLRVDEYARPGGQRALHLVAELYEQSQGRWTRLTCRTGPVSLDELLAGEGWTQLLHELAYHLDLPPAEFFPDTENPGP